MTDYIPPKIITVSSVSEHGYVDKSGAYIVEETQEGSERIVCLKIKNQSASGTVSQMVAIEIEAKEKK